MIILIYALLLSHFSMFLFPYFWSGKIPINLVFFFNCERIDVFKYVSKKPMGRFDLKIKITKDKISGKTCKFCKFLQKNSSSTMSTHSCV